MEWPKAFEDMVYWFKKESQKYGGMSGFVRSLIKKEYDKRTKNI